MADRGCLEDLELSAEEVERLQRAFRDEQFRALFAEYLAELNDPEQRRLYEEEVAALERERGVEVRFVHPTAGYVLRTSQAGSRRCYLNICSNPQVGMPQAHAEPGGHRWTLPYSLAPKGREELSRGGRRLLVYDVVFHPAALRLAARSPRFRRLLSDTALEAVERHCAVQLDRANATVLRGTKYKGVPQAPVIRTPLPGGAPQPPDDSPLPPFPFPPAAPPPPAAPAAPAARPAGPTTPRWSIRHRYYVDLQDYRYSRDSAPSRVPRELVVTVELPLLSSAAQAVLEIRGRELSLDSQRPAYRLRLRLPYDVEESSGRAAFNKAQRQLVVTLPVVPPPEPPEPPDPGGERLEEAEPGGEAPEEPPVAETGGGAAPPPGPAVHAEPPAGGERTPPSSGTAPASPELAGAAPPCPPESSPDMAPPRGCGSPEPAVCPPFQCRQDMASLSLLLPVAGIQPQSLGGEVGTNHYSLRFASDTGTYALFLQFPQANRLMSPETSVSVTAHNAAIGLAKAPGSSGLWEKFHFGIDASTLQNIPTSLKHWQGPSLAGKKGARGTERLFLSEENVDGFLDTVLCPSVCSQSALESQPLIEVLDVTEDRIQIRLEPQEGVHSKGGGEEERLSSSRGDLPEEPNADCPQTEAEPNCTAAGTVEKDPTETSKTSTSFAAAETIGKVGCSSHHCLQHRPSDTAIPGESREKEPDLESAGGPGPVAEDSEKQGGLLLGGQGTEGGDSPTAGWAEGAQPRSSSPVLREVDAQDGSVRSLRDHVTRCPLAFQSSLLYELD